MKILIRLLLVTSLSFIPNLGENTAVQGIVVDFDPLVLRFKNKIFLSDFFHSDTLKTQKYWNLYDEGLSKVVLISIKNQELNFLDFTDTFRITLNTKISTGKSTPHGQFQISKKRKERWSKEAGAMMIFWNCITPDENFGIHSLFKNTGYERNLGRPVSGGCIRISNSVAEEFYKIASIGTFVVIEE